jgi:TPR repeat protein
MKSLFLFRCSFAILVVILEPLAQGATWWVESKSDAQWTNRPLSEILNAAQDTNALAQFYVARACFYGSGRSQDLKEAFAYLKRAASQNLPDAQYMLSRFYMSGTGTGQDTEAGMQWAERAAAHGHADALAILGDTYGSENSAHFDAAKARDYFQRAIDAGSIWALDWFGHFLRDGEAHTAAKTNYAAALQCFERAASNGMTHAASHVVDFYLKGLGAPPSIERAVFWARQGVVQNDVELMEKLAGLYNSGVAEPRDASETPLELLRRAAGGRASGFEIDGAQAYSSRELYALTHDVEELCKRYRFGIGGPRDYISFAQWLFVLKQAAEWEADLNPRRGDSATNQHVFDQIVAGKMSATTTEDARIREAVTLAHRALEMGDASACRQIGEMYRQGSSLTPESPILAWLWLNRATELKDSAAAKYQREVESILTSEQLTKVKNRYLPKANRQQ